MLISLLHSFIGINVVTNREKYNYVEVRSHQKDNFKTIRLDLFGISRRDTPTTFRCESYEDGETFSESISFQIRGISLSAFQSDNIFGDLIFLNSFTTQCSGVSHSKYRCCDIFIFTCCCNRQRHSSLP